MTIDFLINHLNRSFELSDQGISKLGNEILEMEGMTGIKTRHFYNNICGLDNINYLEVGTWKGSSFVSANYKNNIHSLAVDNFEEFTDHSFNNTIEHPRISFHNNMKSFCHDNDYNFIEKDSFQLNHKDLPFPSADIYLYDGNHDFDPHKKAITFFTKFLSKNCIILVDDWTWGYAGSKYGESVIQKATYEGLEESGIIVHHKIERVDDMAMGGTRNYWNGIGAFVCEVPSFDDSNIH